MTAALEVGEWSASILDRKLPPGKNGIHFTEGCVGSRSGLDGRKNSFPPVFNTGLSRQQSVAIPNELPHSYLINNTSQLIKRTQTQI